MSRLHAGAHSSPCNFGKGPIFIADLDAGIAIGDSSTTLRIFEATRHRTVTVKSNLSGQDPHWRPRNVTVESGTPSNQQAYTGS
jgi:hypothetical protein